MLKLLSSLGSRFPLFTTAALTFSVWLTGQYLKDRTLLSGLMFYLPSPVIAGLLILFAAAGRKRPDYHRRRRVLLLLPILPLWFVVGIENQWVAPAPASATVPGAAPAPKSVPIALSAAQPAFPAETANVHRVLRLVHWNVGWPAQRWPAQRSLLRDLDADFYVLSEISESVRDDDFPGFSVLRLKGMLMAARGSLSATGTLVPYGVVQAFVIRCEVDARPIRIMMADMASPPGLPRDPYLRPMMRAAAERQADIVVGDMNAPRRSLAFSEMPGGFRHAYDAAGSGWSYTWPVPIPVLAIDQCICGPDVTAVNYELRSTMLSDHRLQVLDFRLNRPPDNSDGIIR